MPSTLRNPRPRQKAAGVPKEVDVRAEEKARELH